MGIFDWLGGQKQTSDKLPTSRPASHQETSPPHHTPERPFEIIATAEQCWKSGDCGSADELFRRGIGAYERHERDGLDFALGRYGAFLINQNRLDEAARVLGEAVARKTDIPAIWADYLGIATYRRDIDTFRRGVELMTASLRHRVDSDYLLYYARRADREGDPAFAEAIANYVIDRAVAEGDRTGRWKAIGDLGRILERSNRPDEAAKLWRSAFEEGSTDGETLNRLSMRLERAKDYAGAVAVIEDSLKRDLPANVKESLRKRLARCEEKMGPKRSKGRQKRADVPAYSIRHESTLFRPVFQVRPKPPVRDLELVHDVARCLLASRESSTLLDIDVSTGMERRRVEALPFIGETWFSPDGAGIGIRRTAAVGKGPTLLAFVDAEGRVASEMSVPDATSDIALGPDLWYVGCRNGLLYCFDFEGKQRWTWETPGSKNYDGDSYFRPCPYYIASQQSFAAVASLANIYAVGPNGRTMWHAELPNEHQTRWEFTVPFEGDIGLHEAYRTLGLSPEAARDDVKSAYRRLALQTHSDRNPDDDEAAAKFRQVQGAYERALAGPDTGATAVGSVTFSIEIHGMGPMASFVSANSAGVVVGSSQGRLYRFDAGGTLQEARVLGDSSVRAALRRDGSVGAAWCNDALFFLKDGRIVNAAGAVSWPRGLTMFGDDVVLWQGNEVHVMDAAGRLLLAVEFSKTVTSIATQGDTLVCAAGVLAAFRRANALT